VLVNEQDGNIFAPSGVQIEGSFDCGVIGLLVNDEEVFGGIWRRRDMLGHVSVSSLDIIPTVVKYILLRQREAGLLLNPAIRCELGQKPGWCEEYPTSSPITARNCLSLYAVGSAIV
jgi:hypothetical protein